MEALLARRLPAPGPPHRTPSILITALPPCHRRRLRPQELLQLFWGLQARPGSTHILAENGGAVEAYVDFESPDQALQARALGSRRWVGRGLCCAD